MIRIPTKIVHLLSGGMDSTMLLYELHSQGENIHCILVDYAQQHAKELSFAKRHCDKLKVKYTVVELHRIKGLFSHSQLTDGKGGIIVPNRNAILLHIAVGIGLSHDAEIVTIGCNKDDGQMFPDCRREFVDAMNQTLKAAEIAIEIIAPFLSMTKWQIVQHCKEKGYPYKDTWSCYAGGQEPCGKCHACKARKAALK